MDGNIESLISDWKNSAVSEITSSDEIDRLPVHALHIARILAYPDLDVLGTLAKIESMGHQVTTMIKSSNTPRRPTLIIEKINDLLFNVEKFKANTNDYYNPLNSYLNVVLERKTGIPITLSVLYSAVAKVVGFKMYPVSFPAHFLVKHVLEDGSGEIIVDPFNGGRIMDDYSLKALLDQAFPRQNIPLTHALVEKSTPAQVVIRILNNLKGSYYESQDMQKYSLANEMILAIDQYNPEATRDKGVILLREGKSEEALKILNMYLEINPEAEDADEILGIIRQIRSGPK
ncbi:MAG TPA: transglutaminase-like domain-containing protein [Nitrososphaera sp.]|nr:transglutaminase-like domain-containing protein [Nitrososphaera sp.]